MLLPCLLFVSLCTALNAPGSGIATGCGRLSRRRGSWPSADPPRAAAARATSAHRLIVGVAAIHFAVQFTVGYLLRAIFKPPADFRNGLVGAYQRGGDACSAR